MKKKLVIVESPAKAKTLSRILGKSYSLKSSLGHVRDLPKSKLGVDTDNAFTPSYVVPAEKKKVVNELKAAAKTASAVYLATDPDREGEAISWHIAELIATDKLPFRRVVFHEITNEAVEHAFANPRSIDLDLVNAQQARRVLDRLVGYKISPLLWRKVRRGLSAGRVQSAALKIIVDREREIEKFVPAEYWSIEAELSKRTARAVAFRATLIGLIDGGKLEIHTQKQADGLREELEDARYGVLGVKEKKVSRQPAPPFITSTLQQEAWRKLHFSAKQTMAVAQQLYEGLPIGAEGNVGLITYMRTDSTRVARSAIAETREYIEAKHGADYLPPHARSFIRKVKGAQEAHEAIRPTRVLREPVKVKSFLNAAQFKVYQLIWQRMVASQMAAAVYDNTAVDVDARSADSKASYLLRASASTISFPGFTVLYTEGKDESNGDKEKASALPALSKGDLLKLLGLFPEQHFTQPPPRFTEATLVKTLEQYGIGRPSTYAPILSTLQERDYVTKAGGTLKPSELGMLVNDLVAQYFPNVVDVEFTARMEDELDEVAEDKRDWVGVVRDFYIPFQKSLESAAEQMQKVKIAPEATDQVCPQCGKPVVIKTGRFGKFFACSGFPECKYTASFKIKLGVKCPECGADLVQRVSKKKRTFYGCSAYPKCTFATSLKPLPEPCPKCGSLLTQYRGDLAKCTKCSYRGKVNREDR